MTPGSKRPHWAPGKLLLPTLLAAFATLAPAYGAASAEAGRKLDHNRAMLQAQPPPPPTAVYEPLPEQPEEKRFFGAAGDRADRALDSTRSAVVDVGGRARETYNATQVAASNLYNETTIALRRTAAGTVDSVTDAFHDVLNATLANVVNPVKGGVDALQQAPDELRKRLVELLGGHVNNP